MHHTSMHRPLRFNPVPLALAVALALNLPLVAQAQSTPNTKTASIAIAAQPLGSALNELSAATGSPIAYSSALVAGKMAPAVKGRLTTRQAVDQLLTGSGLIATQEGASLVIKVASVPSAQQETTLPVVTATASAEFSADLPKAYAGGQVARGSRAGLLGNMAVMDAPFNATSYTSELIENQQAITLADVLINDPSVRKSTDSLTSAAAAGDSFIIRGFSTQNAVLFDGIAGVAPDRTFPVETAERVEVLKGPNALLNGMAPNGSTGGAINVVPKRADDVPLTRLTTTYSSKGVLGAHLDWGWRFGEENQWGIRVNGVYRNGKTATDGQSIDLGTATVGIDYRGQDLRASLDAGHLTLRNEAPSGAGGIGFESGISIPGAPSASHQIAQDWEFSRTRSSYFLAKLEYDVAPDWTLYGAVGASKNRNEYLSTDIFVQDTLGNGLATVYYWPNFANYKTAQAGLRGVFHTASHKHQVNLNASYLEKDSGYTADYYGFTSFPTNIHNPSFVPEPSIDGFSSRPPKTDAIQLPSLALSDTISLLDDRVAVTLGARHQSVKTTTYDSRTGIGTTAYDESAVTPMLAIVFKPQANISIYGNYMEGLGQGETAPLGTTNAGHVFAPIKTKQHEVGVKYDLGRFTATASLFQIQKPSATTVANADGTSTYKMDGEQRNRGVEVNVFGEVTRGLRLLGGVAYTHAKLIQTENGSNDGKFAPNVSRWQLNLGTEYDLTAVPGLTLSARMISTSSQYLNEANEHSIPGWTRWDMGARYKTRAMGRWLVLRAGIENLLGRDYWTTASGSWVKLGGPRTVTVSATMDF